MKYKPPFEWKRGRVSVTASWRTLSLPRVFLYVDGDAVTAGASFGTDGCDPAAMLDVDLTGTRVGKLVARIYCWALDRREAGR